MVMELVGEIGSGGGGGLVFCVDGVVWLLVGWLVGWLVGSEWLN